MPYASNEFMERRRSSPLMLDITRLLSRAGARVPTGIDRVELSYAEHLLAYEPERSTFVALHPLGLSGSLPFEQTRRFITLLSAQWRVGGVKDSGAERAARHLLHRHLLLSSDRAGRPETGSSGLPGRPLYLLLSHHHLTRATVIARFLARRRAAFVPMVHDLIPTDYPEFARPNEPAKHLRRMATVGRFADAVLVPSEVVRQRVLPHLHKAGRGHVPVHVAPHGVHFSTLAAPPVIGPSAPAYFVCLGTIEPRKNHLLLLNIWRRLVEIHGGGAPKLVLIGRRGWENENIIDMIERCPALRGVVEEHNALPDRDVTRLLKGARALLIPSFAEGYGLPLAEALALQVPVICSDIEIFREVGGQAPQYLDPLDGLGWMRMIESYAGAAQTSAQPRPEWHATSWTESIRASLTYLETLPPNPAGTAGTAANPARIHESAAS